MDKIRGHVKFVDKSRNVCNSSLQADRRAADEDVFVEDEEVETDVDFDHFQDSEEFEGHDQRLVGEKVAWVLEFEICV